MIGPLDCDNIIAEKSTRCVKCEYKHRFLTNNKGKRPSYDQLLYDLDRILIAVGIPITPNISIKLNRHVLINEPSIFGFMSAEALKKITLDNRYMIDFQI